MKTLIETGYDYELYHAVGMTKFIGCQCYKDCDCAIDFNPQPYEGYSVKRTKGKIKTTHHATLEQARERINQFTLYK